MKFKNLKHAEVDARPKKSHIANVGIPLISTARPTKHKKARNYNVNRSNLPEHRNFRNRSAKKELLSYDNLLKTAVRPVKKEKVLYRRTKLDLADYKKGKPRYRKVRPGRLEKKVATQVRIG